MEMYLQKTRVFGGMHNQAKAVLRELVGEIERNKV